MSYVMLLTIISLTSTKPQISVLRKLSNMCKDEYILHRMKCKTRGRVEEIALKIYISKAFDRVDWLYLLALLQKLGFDHKWISWISMCVRSVTYKIMMNGYIISWSYSS